MTIERPPKYPSTPHWPWSETVHRDDSRHRNPEAFVGVEVVVTEKLDGGNTCLYQGEVYARSTASPSHAGWMAMVRKHHAWKTQPGAAGTWDPKIAVYGEDLYGVHSVEYAPMREDETYRVFAVRNCDPADGDLFLCWDEVEAHAQRLGAPTVPVVHRGLFASVEEITEFFKTSRLEGSALGRECEGFVMRYAEPIKATEFSGKVCKYVRPDHVQSDQHWTRNWKPCKIKS